MAGDRSLVDRWTSAARAVSRAMTRYRSGARSCDPRRGGGRQRGSTGELAQEAWGGVPEDSPWLALGYLLRGALGHHLTGEREPARGLLEEGARHAAAGFPSMQSLCLAQLRLLAIERGDWPAAESLSARARRRSNAAVSPLPHLRARVRGVRRRAGARRAGGGVSGRLERRGAAARRARGLQSLVRGRGRTALARAALRLGDLPRAQALPSDAARALQRSPDTRVVLSWDRDLPGAGGAVLGIGGGKVAPRESTAELRILQFLPTHLSFPEVAVRLCVSANTVKTHARSVYRKLDASSRGEAVARAREAGFVPTPA